MALAATLLAWSANAQPRYSINVIGYVDARLVAGSNLFANPLNAVNNAMSNLLAGVPGGSLYLPWNPVEPGYGPTNRFTAGTGWSDGQTQLRRTDAGFLWLPEARTISFVGEPWPGTCLSLRPGFTVTGIIPRYLCGFCVGDCLFNSPDVQMYRWDRDRQEFVPNGNEFEPWWLPTAPQLAPDEAVTFFNLSAQAVSGRSYGPQSLGEVRLMNPTRVGSNFVFEFPAYEGIAYSVQQSDDLTGGAWRTMTNAVTATANAYIQVRVPGSAPHGFFRLYTPRLVNPVRTGSQFQFQFYGEEGVRYQVQRSPSLEGPAWTPVTAIDGAGAVATVTDASAASPAGDYRLLY